MRRRDFFTAVAASKLASPWPLLAQEPESRGMKIASVEFLRLEGRYDAIAGVDNQYQVNALHVYDDLRPKPYHETGQGKPAKVPTSALYLRIRTDAGLEGFYGPIDREAAVVVDQQLRRFLIGKDPLAVETLWDQMHRSNRHARTGHFMMGISAVDNTLWDLRGRYFKVPVYRLLGGPSRAYAEAYVSCLGYSVEPEPARAKAIEFKRKGFRYQKWFMAYGPGDGPAGLAKNVELVRVLREAVGEEVELMFDAFQGWDLNYALAWARQVERYRPRFIEEAFQADKIDSFAQLRRATSIPVASGEHIYSRWEAAEYMKAGALNVIQTDPEWCGGISELVKICTVASLHDVHVMPHGHSIHAALHVVLSQSPMTCPLVEYLFLKMSTYHHFEKSPPQLNGEKFALPQNPGFGIEIDPAKAEKQSVVKFA